MHTKTSTAHTSSTRQSLSCSHYISVAGRAKEVSEQRSESLSVVTSRPLSCTRSAGPGPPRRTSIIAGPAQPDQSTRAGFEPDFFLDSEVGSDGVASRRITVALTSHGT
jgi:hypothetical protein